MIDLLNQLGINISFLFQLAIFILAYGVLSHFLFKPYLKILDQREKETLGNQAEVQTLLKKEREVYQTYKNKLQDLQQEIKTLFQKAEHSAKEICETKRQLAYQRKQQKLVDVQTSLEEQMRKEEAKTEQEAQKLAVILTNKLME